MTKILITGGGGYIGSHVVKMLSEESDQYEITVVDTFFQTRKNIILNENIKYSEVDIRNKTELLETIKLVRPEVVMHFAALASVPDSVKNPSAYYETNVLGTFNLLEAMREVGCKRIIFSSSASVYGEPETEIISETHPKEPTNPYGFTKLIGEKMLESYFKAYDISSISFRYFCAAGNEPTYTLGEYHQPETHAIPSLILTALGGRNEFYIYGDDYPTKDGTGIRDYIHVNDLASAHIKGLGILNNGDGVCEQYNLGINEGFSVRELIKEVEMVHGEKINIKVAPRRPGDPSKLIANASKANEELSWVPVYTKISEIVEHTYHSFKKNNNTNEGTQRL